MRNLTRWWRRSLRTRMVTQTVILSIAMMLLVGWVLLHAVASGLAESRRSTVVNEATSGMSRAQGYLDAAVGSTAEQKSRILTQLVDTLTGTSGEERTFDVLLYGPLSATGQTPVRSSGDLAIEDIPADLAKQVGSDTGVWWRFHELSILGSASEPVVVAGGRLSFEGEHYALYYVFSLAEQQATLDLVRDSLMVGSAVLIVLLAGVAVIVARQIVGPLKEARQVAEEIAAGDLERRMHVRTEDDIARLSISFNQMAEALQAQIVRLENLSQLQQRFVSDVSHELRTPLTTVQMAAQVINDSRQDLEAPAARAAELLSAELERFEALLSDLLDLSRFDAGAARLEPDDVDVAALLARVCERAAAAYPDCEFVLHGADSPEFVVADARRLDRVFRNLCENAAKHSGSDRVVVELTSAAETVSIDVRDTGIGLTSEQQAHVFERFWRADPSRSTSGTGLGLAIVHEDVLLHGATIQVTSNESGGSTFRVVLGRTAQSRGRGHVIEGPTHE